MTANIELLSHAEKATFLARFAHELTTCARDTYQPGTDSFTEPHTLRAYNELLHQVTAAAVRQVVAPDTESIECVISMAKDFGSRFSHVRQIEWAFKQALQRKA
jgi:hypothetical protein